MKYGFSYNYLFQATQPSTGKTFEMFLPRMDGECFTLFIEAFTNDYPQACLIMDNAGSHKTKLRDDLKQKVNIEFLAPYSPDFNPQERMFQEIKKPLKGVFFKELEPIEKMVEKTIKTLCSNTQKVKNITAWDWIT
jgi:transposase